MHSHLCVWKGYANWLCPADRRTPDAHDPDSGPARPPPPRRVSSITARRMPWPGSPRWAWLLIASSQWPSGCWIACRNTLPPTDSDVYQQSTWYQADIELETLVHLRAIHTQGLVEVRTTDGQIAFFVCDGEVLDL